LASETMPIYTIAIFLFSTCNLDLLERFPQYFDTFVISEKFMSDHGVLKSDHSTKAYPPSQASSSTSPHLNLTTCTSMPNYTHSKCLSAHQTRGPFASLDPSPANHAGTFPNTYPPHPHPTTPLHASTPFQSIASKPSAGRTTNDAPSMPAPA